MSADIPKKRGKTAREIADHFGVSPRTIQRMMAEPREQYLARAQEKLLAVCQLRSEGLKTKEISEQLQIPLGTVTRLLKTARDKKILKTTHELVKD